MTARLTKMGRPVGWLDRLLHPDHTEMPWHFERLAGYNSEVDRGIVHTQEYDARMAALQKEFEAWILENRS